MDIESKFQEAVAKSKQLPTQPNETLLELYGLYKQATQGDVSGNRPGMFDPVGRAKYDAWSGHAGMSQEDAMGAYVELVDRLHSEG
jgi:acyl-CoA-binding protein